MKTFLIYTALAIAIILICSYFHYHFILSNTQGAKPKLEQALIQIQMYHKTNGEWPRSNDDIPALNLIIYKGKSVQLFPMNGQNMFRRSVLTYWHPDGCWNGDLTAQLTFGFFGQMKDDSGQKLHYELDTKLPLK